ncbi:Os03g0655550 [Oryza sativa Japonica Group]|uniref:Os03g0655550 protein n=1 Tax=Oryza sativa subsp. japonica TaxID=39947 RepID=A0A0P0W0X6_ORYSJ|nr:Os03g0655550 [Oryza sativa Japonica Group]
MRRAITSSPRLAAAWSAVPPSAPHLASALAPAARSAFTASLLPASAASRRGVLPSLPAASMDVKEQEKEAEDADEGEAEAGFPRSSFRTSLWPAAAATWSASEPAGVAPFARRSSAMRHSPEAAAVSSGVRPRLGLSASAPYSRSTCTMSARPRPTARSSSVRPDSSTASAARHSGSLRSSTSLSASTAPASTRRAATAAPTKHALMPLSTNTCFLLAENHSGFTESSAVTGSRTAAPGATTLCRRNASSPRPAPPPPPGPSGAADARYTTSTVTAASGARIPVCGRTAKRLLTAGCSRNATGMVCIAFLSVSSPLAGLPGSTRTTTSFVGSGITSLSISLLHFPITESSNLNLHSDHTS